MKLDTNTLKSGLIFPMDVISLIDVIKQTEVARVNRKRNLLPMTLQFMRLALQGMVKDILDLETPTIKLPMEVMIKRIVKGKVKPIKTDVIIENDVFNGHKISFSELSQAMKPNHETGHSEVELNTIVQDDKSNMELKFSTKNNNEVEQDEIVFKIFENYFKTCVKSGRINPDSDLMFTQSLADGKTKIINCKNNFRQFYKLIKMEAETE